MLNKVKIGYDYAMAIKAQLETETLFIQALNALGSDNADDVALAKSLSTPYGFLVKEILGEAVFTQLEWWMFDTAFGSFDEVFTVDGKTYRTGDMTLLKFLELHTMRTFTSL